MNKKELKRILEQHRLYINTDGEEGEAICLENGEDISGFDLSKAVLEGALFYNINMQGVDLTGADLYGVVFEGCNLIDAKFSIEIRECCDLTGASVSKEQLYWLALHPRFKEFLPTLKIK